MKIKLSITALAGAFIGASATFVAMKDGYAGFYSAGSVRVKKGTAAGTSVASVPFNTKNPSDLDTSEPASCLPKIAL